MEQKDKLDKIFSLYIRLRDCPDGYGNCISCGAAITPKTGECGHFIPRGITSTRWDERNCNAQCHECNSYKDANIPGYTIGLVTRYGDGIVEELKQLRRMTLKIGPSDYKHKIQYYTQKTKELL